MFLRQADIQDISSIMEIEKQAFILSIQEKQETFLQRIQTFPQGFLLFSIEQNSVPLGYFASELWKSYTIPHSFALEHSALKSHCPNGNILYISSFGLVNHCRGKGWGKKFFQEAISLIISSNKQISSILLLVNENWLNARHIYKSLGFTEIHTISHFFPTSESGIIMEKTL
jgi:ribosomal-protein-alanine N-acetyltransferase